MTEPIKGLDKLLRKLKSIEELRGAKKGLRAGALQIKGKIAVYPPSSEANMPNQRRWYERGWGSKWLRKDGTVGGRKTSQTLGHKWTLSARNGGLTQVVGNNVTYGPYVQTAEKQVAYHKARGWKTDKQIIDEEQETIVEIVKRAIEAELE